VLNSLRTKILIGLMLVTMLLLRLSYMMLFLLMLHISDIIALGCGTPNKR